MAFNLAYRIMSDDAAAADATQDAVISMYRKLDSYRGGSFKAWFMRIVTNACYDELRKRKPPNHRSNRKLTIAIIESPTAG